MRQFGAISGGDKMPAFTDDNSMKKFKNKTEEYKNGIVQGCIHCIVSSFSKMNGVLKNE